MRSRLIYIGLIVLAITLLFGNLVVCVEAAKCHGSIPNECNGKCVSLQSDKKNCGECGNVCGGGDVCHKGECVSSEQVGTQVGSQSKGQSTSSGPTLTGKPIVEIRPIREQGTSGQTRTTVSDNDNKATCIDSKKSGKETDVDCGGPTCQACADGKVCNSGTDCSSRVCRSGICQTSTCTDKVKNGDETGRDCGGSCPPCTQQASLSKKPIINTGAITALPGKVLSPPSVEAAYSCEGLLCTCHGDDDCNDMFLHAGCGDVSSCTDADCSCLRLP